VVHPKVRSEVPNSHVGKSIGFAEHDENADRDSKTKVAEKDELGVLGFVQRTGRVEVVDAGKEPVDPALSATFKLALVVVVAGDIAKKIHWPAQELLSNGMEQGGNGGLLSQFVKFVHQFSDTASIHLASLGNEDHVTLHVASGLVMLAMGNLP